MKTLTKANMKPASQVQYSIINDTELNLLTYVLHNSIVAFNQLITASEYERPAAASNNAE